MTKEAPKFSTDALNTFLPQGDILTNPDRSREHGYGARLSLYVPTGNEDYLEYASLMGSVMPYFPTNALIDDAGRTHTDMREITLGKYLKVIDIPHELRNIPADDLLLPTGAQLLGEGQSVCGRRFYRDRFGPNKTTHIAVYTREFPEVPQERRDHLHAQYSALRATV